MAELLASVLSASKRAAASIEADMLGFNVLMCVRSAFLLATLQRLLLARTTTLSALMASTVKLCSAGTEAHGLLHVALMAH
jgi:hypothetical protein